MSIVDTKYGKVEGHENGAIEEFLGLAFAKPPVGDLRFKAPQAPDAWKDVYQADKFGGAAPQMSIPIFNVGEIAEDCLYLNVWTPAVDGKKRAVMFWIHGGGFFIGSAAQAEYSGAALAEKGDVVVVGINYRLGALGFAHLQDALGDAHQSDTNLGMRDQVAALQWVRDNIDQFGGDPDNVTIFGESAGGMSVATLMAIPSAEGLFHKAIPQSGAGHNAVSKAGATKVAEKLLSSLNITQDNAADLQTIPYEAILKAQMKCSSVEMNCGPWNLPSIGMAFVPVVDGDFLPDHPYNMIKNGLSKNVSLLIGTTAEEWKLFGMLANLMPKDAGKAGSGGLMGGDMPDWLNVTEDNIVSALDSQIPGQGKAAAEAYKNELGEKTEPSDIFGAMQTDKVFTQPALRFAAAQLAHNDEIYMYRFDFKSPIFAGACHAIDIPFVFDTIDSQFGMMFTGGGDGPKALATLVQGAWLAFAKTGNPSHAGLPEWALYDQGKRSTMVFDNNCSVVENPRAETNLFWEKVS